MLTLYNISNRSSNPHLENKMKNLPQRKTMRTSKNNKKRLSMVKTQTRKMNQMKVERGGRRGDSQRGPK